MIIHWKINGQIVSASKEVYDHVQELERQVMALNGHRPESEGMAVVPVRDLIRLYQTGYTSVGVGAQISKLIDQSQQGEA